MRTRIKNTYVIRTLNFARGKIVGASTYVSSLLLEFAMSSNATTYTGSSSASASDCAPEPKRRRVSHATYLTWKRDLDRECSTMSWLECETQVSARKKVVIKLLCNVCKRFKERIQHRRNFSESWIFGADSVRTSNIRDHSRADQHVHAMMLLKKEQGNASSGACCSYSPIVQALNKLPELEKSQLRVKFDLAYFIAREKMPFSKYPKLCELEARHNVPVGTAYTNQIA